MPYFEKMLRVPPDRSRVLPLDHTGRLPSFRPPCCPLLEKNPAGAHVLLLLLLLYLNSAVHKFKQA